MKNLKNKLFIIFSLLCALALTSCMDLYDGSEVSTKFTITFKANIEGSSQKDVVCELNYGEKKKLSDVTFIHPQNWDLIGWSENATSPETLFPKDAEISVKSGMTLYAIWQEPGGETPEIKGGGIQMIVSVIPDAELGLDAVAPETGYVIKIYVNKDFDCTWYLNEDTSPLTLTSGSSEISSKDMYEWDASSAPVGENCIMLVAVKDGRTYSASIYVKKNE